MAWQGPDPPTQARHALMKYWHLLIFVGLMTGCIQTPPNLAEVEPAVEEQFSVVAGDVELVLREGRQLVAPVGSATAGSTWLEYTVSYTNKSAQPIWIFGYSPAYPFSGIQTRLNHDAEWHSQLTGYCGTGANQFEIAPNATHQFAVSIPEKHLGQEFRVMLPYSSTSQNPQWVRAASKAHLIVLPLEPKQPAETTDRVNPPVSN